MSGNLLSIRVGHVPYLEPSQTIAGAVVLSGDCVILSTNGNPANMPLSVVALSQANASKIDRINTIPLKPVSRAHALFILQWIFQISESTRWMLARTRLPMLTSALRQATCLSRGSNFTGVKLYHIARSSR